MPTLLVYSFGIYFLAYLRGVGSTTLFLYELMYDIIAFVIFYTRITVQGIRLVMLLATFALLNEFILTFNFPQKSFICSEYF